MYPKDWSDADVVYQFTEGLKAGSTKVPGTDHMYKTTTPSGVEVIYFILKTNITNFYPVYKGAL